jgi:hypothetical protein
VSEAAALADALSVRPSGLPLQTAAEICREADDEPAYILHRIAASGSVTLLFGKLKRGGKTTLLLHGIRQCTRGEPFLSQPTRKTPVVYLTEQPPRTFRSQLEAAGLADCKDLHVSYWHKTHNLPWHEVVQRARVDARRLGAKLLIVDTFGQYTGLESDKENDSGAALAAVQPLKAASAEDGIAVVIVTHERKSGGDVADAARGSSAIAGAVDILFRVQQVRAQSPQRRVDGVSRIEGPFEMLIELTDAGYAVCDTATHEEPEVPTTEGLLLKTLPTSAVAAISSPQLESMLKERAGVSRATVGRLLRKLSAAGVIQCDGSGVAGDPHRYWRPTSAGQLTPTL